MKLLQECDRSVSPKSISCIKESTIQVWPNQSAMQCKNRLKEMKMTFIDPKSETSLQPIELGHCLSIFSRRIRTSSTTSASCSSRVINTTQSRMNNFNHILQTMPSNSTLQQQIQTRANNRSESKCLKFSEWNYISPVWLSIEQLERKKKAIWHRISEFSTAIAENCSRSYLLRLN